MLPIRYGLQSGVRKKKKSGSTVLTLSCRTPYRQAVHEPFHIIQTYLILNNEDSLLDDLATWVWPKVNVPPWSSFANCSCADAPLGLRGARTPIFLRKAPRVRRQC
jgi:hypothetical protein